MDAKAKLEYSRSERGKRAYKKWFESRGREVTARYRKNNPEVFMKYQAKRRASVKTAENARQRWTLAEEKKLVEYVSNGVPYEEIAKKFNRSISSVDHKFSKLKRGL